MIYEQRLNKPKLVQQGKVERKGNNCFSSMQQTVIM